MKILNSMSSRFGILSIFNQSVLVAVITDKYLSVFSPNAGKCGKNEDQNNSEYGHFLRSECCKLKVRQ